MLRAHPHSKQKVRACSKHSSFSQFMDMALLGQSVSQRERERGRERKRERQRDRERMRGGEREKDVEYGCFIFIFNRNDGCLGTF
jgi:hypothetical protein